MTIRQDKILVTGGAGFIASHLVELLVAKGARVTVLDDLSAGKQENLAAVRDDIEFVQGSVCNPETVDRAASGCRMIFNFAANADVPRSVKHPDIDFRTNSMGMFNVLSAARKHGVERTLQASTAAVYGEPEYTPMDEQHPLRPISPYGASKLSAEAIGMAWFHSYGLPFTAIRIFNTYGPRQPRYVIHDLFRKLQKDPKHLEVLGTGEQIRDYCYVTDTAGAFLALALNAEADGQVYNIAGGQPVSIRELVDMILHTLDYQDTEITYTGKSWPGDISRLVADISKISDQGFSPRINLSEGLRRFANWIQP